MYERKIPLNLNCGLDLIGEVLYGKWKILLLWFINEGHQRPREFQRKIPDASRRVLNIQLKEMEGHDLVTKKNLSRSCSQGRIFVNGFWKTLIPVILVLGEWGDKNEERLRSLILKNP
tara:strand:+ start:10319 stop:10672 length:354 start_codon:yes stop_codon:yes gene_type:complete